MVVVGWAAVSALVFSVLAAGWPLPLAVLASHLGGGVAVAVAVTWRFGGGCWAVLVGAPSAAVVGVSAVVGLLSFVVLGVALRVADRLFGLPVFEEVLLAEVSSVWRWVAVAVLVLLVAPVVEEVVFRGPLLDVLAARFGAGVAVVATGALFASFHGAPPAQSAVLLAFGVVLAVLRRQAGSVVAPVVAHAAYNLAVLISNTSWL